MQRFILGSVTGGVAATFCLFLLMSFLIKAGSDKVLIKPKEFKPIDTVIYQQEDKITTIRRKPPEKPQEQKPPPPQAQSIAQNSKPTLSPLQLQIEAPSFDGINVVVGQQRGTGSDGEAVPIFTTEPRYPAGAAERGTQGWVKFKFTVGVDGSPKDIELVDAEPKHAFNHAAKKAISNWRFQPKKVNGKPVEQKGMVYTMVFQLEDEKMD